MELARLLAQLDDALLGELFSANALTRARAYVGRVRNIETAGNQLQALVQGSEAVPYRVSVRVERREFFGKSSIELSTRCTCPVGNRCKHAAALILAARRPGTLVDRPRAEIVAWAKTLGERVAKAAAPKKPIAAKEGIFYLCSAWQGGDDVEFSLLKARLGPAGEPAGAIGEWYNYEQALLKPPSFVRDEDMQIFRQLREMSRRGGGYGRPVLRGADGRALLEAALATGRTCVALDDSGAIAALAAGPLRPGRLEWVPVEGGLKARLRVEPAAALVIRTEPPMYLDAGRQEAGRVSIDGGAAIAEAHAQFLKP